MPVRPDSTSLPLAASRPRTPRRPAPHPLLTAQPAGWGGACAGVPSSVPKTRRFRSFAQRKALFTTPPPPPNHRPTNAGTSYTYVLSDTSGVVCNGSVSAVCRAGVINRFFLHLRQPSISLSPCSPLPLACSPLQLGGVERASSFLTVERTNVPLSTNAPINKQVIVKPCKPVCKDVETTVNAAKAVACKASVGLLAGEGDFFDLSTIGANAVSATIKPPNTVTPALVSPSLSRLIRRIRRRVARRAYI
jgi:hypothetical protein